MKLSISNIAWDIAYNDIIYNKMKKYGFEGLEIAPTKLISQNPYDNTEEAVRIKKELENNYSFTIPSMQSIWYGRSENIFASPEERAFLEGYMKMAILFAEAIECRNLVFGCPRNRNLPQGKNSDDAVDFFRTVGDFAALHNTIIGMEANPPIYNTNYINDTHSAIELIEKVNSRGFRLNLDVGTMIENGESENLLKGFVKYVNHVHISEPNLKPIKERELHKGICKVLADEGYKGYISIEMGGGADIDVIDGVMKYVAGIFR